MQYAFMTCLLFNHSDSNTQIVDLFIVLHMLLLYVVAHELFASNEGGGGCALYFQFIQKILEYKLK